MDHFGQPQTYSWSENGEKKSTKSEPLVNPEAVKKEWNDLKQKLLALMYPRDQIATLWKLINQYHKDDFPELIKLAHLALTCPVHTAGCERGFSVQNLILTSSRNRLNPGSRHAHSSKIRGAR